MGPTSFDSAAPTLETLEGMRAGEERWHRHWHWHGLQASGVEARDALPRLLIIPSQVQCGKSMRTESLCSRTTRPCHLAASTVAAADGQVPLFRRTARPLAGESGLGRRMGRRPYLATAELRCWKFVIKKRAV